MPDEQAPGQQAGLPFALPAVDDLPSTEAGMILLSLDAEHLLAGLGLAALSDDPAAVTLLVDQVGHAGLVHLEVGRLIAAGIRRWRAARAMLAEPAGQPPAWPRHAWPRAYRVLAETGQGGPAIISYLTACWLRAAEIDTYADAIAEIPEEDTWHVLPELAARRRRAAAGPAVLSADREAAARAARAGHAGTLAVHGGRARADRGLCFRTERLRLLPRLARRHRGRVRTAAGTPGRGRP